MVDVAKINFRKMNGLVPCVVQDSSTNVVLMLGFMNEEAFQKTEQSGRVTFYSRSKKRLWTKGEESGNFLIVKDLKVDCDQDTILIKADPVGPVCHTGADTCWDEQNIALGCRTRLQPLYPDRSVNSQAGDRCTKTIRPR